jgi:hypothetical protein
VKHVQGDFRLLLGIWQDSSDGHKVSFLLCP